MTIFRDLRHGLRILIRNPGFGVSALAIIAVGMGDNFLSLGVAPVMGRQVSSRADAGERWITGVNISFELWQRRWHGDPAVVGRGIEVNNIPMRIVGIMPRGFRLYLGEATGIAPRVDVWFPISPGDLPGRCPGGD
jgi:hypothetical protein